MARSQKAKALERVRPRAKNEGTRDDAGPLPAVRASGRHRKAAASDAALGRGDRSFLGKRGPGPKCQSGRPLHRGRGAPN